MRQSVLSIVVCVGLVLGCGGGGGGFGGGGSEFAQNMAKHGEQEHPKATPALSYGVGSEVTLGDFSFRLGEPVLMDPETDVKYIKNVTERNRFGKPGIKALVIPYELKNNSPVKKKRDVWWTVHSRAGDELFGGGYNEGIYLEEHGIESYGREVPPGKWHKKVFVMAIQEDDANGTLGWFKQWETQINEKDPRGRKIEVVISQAVVDIADPTSGPHINPARR